MSIHAWLCGDPGRTPFIGHLRVTTNAGLAAAGRLSAGAGVEGAFGPARALERALRGARGRDRFALLRGAWQAVIDLPPEALGPQAGADLQLLLVASDTTGMAVAGLGLGAVWGSEDGRRFTPLVEPGHPLLAGPGRPPSPPGALDLDGRPTWVMAMPSHLEPVLPAEPALRCGVHP